MQVSDGKDAPGVHSDSDLSVGHIAAEVRRRFQASTALAFLQLRRCNLADIAQARRSDRRMRRGRYGEDDGGSDGENDAQHSADGARLHDGALPLPASLVLDLETDARARNTNALVRLLPYQPMTPLLVPGSSRVARRLLPFLGPLPAAHSRTVRRDGWLPAVTENEQVPLPTFAAAAGRGELLLVSPDGLEVTYCGNGRRTGDGVEMRSPVATLYGNRDVDSRLPLYYYEVTIQNVGVDGAIGVGLSESSSLADRIHPGWTPGTYGYHGDDGEKVRAFMDATWGWVGGHGAGFEAVGSGLEWHDKGRTARSRAIEPRSVLFSLFGACSVLVQFCSHHARGCPRQQQYWAAPSSRSSSYAQKFATGDIIGCGFLGAGANKIFFTRNGNFLGIGTARGEPMGRLQRLACAHKVIHDAPAKMGPPAFTRQVTATSSVRFSVRPMIGLHTTGLPRVRINFGQQPFRFDITTLAQRWIRSDLFKASSPARCSKESTTSPSTPATVGSGVVSSASQDDDAGWATVSEDEDDSDAGDESDEEDENEDEDADEDEDGDKNVKSSSSARPSGTAGRATTVGSGRRRQGPTTAARARARGGRGAALAPRRLRRESSGGDAPSTSGGDDEDEDDGGSDDGEDNDNDDVDEGDEDSNGEDSNGEDSNGEDSNGEDDDASGSSGGDNEDEDDEGGEDGSESNGSDGSGYRRHRGGNRGAFWDEDRGWHYANGRWLRDRTATRSLSEVSRTPPSWRFPIAD